MGASLLGSNGTTAINSALTRQQVLCGGSSWNSLGETNTRHRFSQAGTLTKLWAYISANSLDAGTTTIKSRINLANGNNSLSIGFGATGEFEDASNSDTINAGDLVEVQIVTSGTSGSITPRCLAAIYTPSGTHNYKLFSESVGGLAMGASVTNYLCPFGTNATNGTEANAQFKVRTSGTLRNAYVRVSANTRSDTTTIRSRINGGNGNILISVGAAATGDFTDLSNTDTIADGDLICWSLVTPGGTGSITFRTFALELDDASAAFEMGNQRAAGTAYTTATTRYNSVQGGIASETTEANQQQNSALAFTASKLRCYISANTWTLAATLRTRINGGNGAQSVSITSATTGWFEDASNTDSIVAGDLIDTSFVTAGSGSLTLHTIALTGATSSPQTLTPDAADYDWTANDPTLSPGGVSLTPDAAVVTWTANTPTIAPGGVSLTPDAAVVAWTALDAVMSPGAASMTPDPAVVNWTANNPTMVPGAATLSPSPAVVNWTANDIQLSSGGISVDPAVIQWVANDITLRSCEVLKGCTDAFFDYDIETATNVPNGEECAVVKGCADAYFGYGIER